MTPELSPLVLLHGGSWSGDQWRDIAPLLSAHHDVYTPSALGHHGGPVVQRRPVTIWDVIDESERYLDERGLDRPHLAGHSMGGFIALELARRGRAASVCAFSPGGLWSDELRAQVAKRLRRQFAVGRLMRPITPLLMKSPRMRRRGWTDLTLHGDRLSYQRAIEIGEVSLACTIIGDIFNNADEQVAPMDPLPCPITIAWAEKDRILPVELCEAIARDRLPRATFTILPGLPHAPTIDDPELVASTILAVTGAQGAAAQVGDPDV
ncbi:alpha/beta fold hydrolase [Mycobacterium sp.]|uniref:alpha/beta fold hydrolase n=1 Tax=Mycobacterium sp. TaxID=1785 RepID=UPI003C78F451